MIFEVHLFQYLEYQDTIGLFLLKGKYYMITHKYLMDLTNISVVSFRKYLNPLTVLTRSF